MQTTTQEAIAALLVGFTDLLAGYPERDLGETPAKTVTRALAQLPEAQWGQFNMEIVGITDEDVRRFMADELSKKANRRPGMIHGVVLTDLQAKFDPESDNVRIVNQEAVVIAEVPQFGPDFDGAGQGEIQTAIANAIIKGLTP